MRILILFVVLCFVQKKVESQTIVRYPQGSVVEDLVDPNVTVSEITFGPGISQVTCANYVICDGFNQSTNTNALNNGDFFEFTIFPQPGFVINISTISVLTTGSNLTGTPLLQRAFYYKKQSQSAYTFLASYQSTSLGSAICTNSSSGSIPNVNVATNEAITFRIVYYNNTTGVQARIGQVTVLGNTVLPVHLKSFNLETRNNQNILTFSTTSEINNSGFDIERSVDGIEFEKIGWVEGHGNTSEEQHYYFVDKNPMSGINYYQLKQLDYDGKFEYSNIVSGRNQNDKVMIYPNPVAERIILSESEGIPYKIFNHMMQVMGQGILDSSSAIDAVHLVTGVYFLTLEGQEEYKRFVKL